MKKILIAATVAAAIACAPVAPASAYVLDGLVLNIDARSNSTSVIDLSELAHDATIVGAVTVNSDAGTLDFAGGGIGRDYVSLDSGFSDFTDGITIDFEANFGSNIDGWERIFDFSAGGRESDNLLVGRFESSDKLIIEFWHGEYTYGRLLTEPGAIVPGETAQWNITVTSDGLARVFKNGVELGLGLPSDGIFTTGGYEYGPPSSIERTSNYLGRSNWDDMDFEGSISYLRIYNRILSDSELAENRENRNPEVLAKTGIDGVFLAIVGVATLALGVAIRRRARS